MEPLPQQQTQQPNRATGLLKDWGWLIAAALVVAQAMGYLTPEQAATIKAIVPVVMSEKPNDSEPVPAIEPTPVAESMTPQQWAELIKGIIEQLKPVPQPTPVDPTPKPKPVDPLPTPPAGLAILVSDETGKPITSSTVEAGSLFRVSAVGAKGEISWQSVKSGDVRLSASTDGKEFAGYLSPGQWVDFGLTDYESRKQLSVRISCNQGPRPPPNVVPVDPVDPDPPGPEVGRVSLAVVYDVKKISPETAIVLNSTDVFNEFTAAGSEWLFYSIQTPEPLGKQAVEDAGDTLPALVIYRKGDRNHLATVPLPKTVEDLRATVAKYTGVN